MNTNAFCPISNKKIDDHVARINSSLTLALLVVFITTGNIIPILFLFVDFALRSGKLSRYSVLSYISKKILKVITLKPEMINAGPKIFASRIGLFFTVTIIVFTVFGIDSMAYIFSGILGFCAFLESFFGFCVACQIYPFVYKLFYHNKIQKLEI
ncbi:MAG: DUF4395 domain-containing protein [Paludibacter sp.]|nr:DUF4395 domain-containing protein [Paludibacter sp.]